MTDSPYSSWISATPCSTILVFNTPINYGVVEIQTLFQRYGAIKSVEKLPDGDVALVDFVNLTEAASFVEMGRNNPFFVGANRAHLECCVHRLMDTNEAGMLSKVMRMEVNQVTYPITVDVIQAICSANAPPSRILIGPLKETKTLDVLVEFANNSDARKVRDALHGNDIYSGCCSLSCSLSGIPVLLVTRNDPARSWDYISFLPSGNAAMQQQQRVGLLGTQPGQTPPMPVYPNYAVPPPQFHHPPPAGWAPVAAPPPQFYPGMRPPMNVPPPSPYAAPMRPPGPGVVNGGQPYVPFVPGEGSVVFFNKLAPKMFNCDRLFNLCCLYGNVARVKCLKSREGVAMVQMGNPQQGQHLLTYLNNITLFDHLITMAPCKLPEIDENTNILYMEDGSPYIKNFINNPNNRFRTPATASKSRIQAPTTTLHFFNAPSNVTEDSMLQLFVQLEAPLPHKVVVFPLRADQKTSIGLMEWPTVREAMEAIVLANNYEMHVQGVAHPFHLKLAFSSKGIDGDKLLQSLHKRIAEGEAAVAAETVKRKADSPNNGSVKQEPGNEQDGRYDEHQYQDEHSSAAANGDACSAKMARLQ